MKHDTGKGKTASRNIRKKLTSSLLFGLLAMALLIGFAPRKAAAEDKYKNNITTIKKNTWTQLKGYTNDHNWDTGISTYSYQVKKFTVPANGYVKIQTNSSKISFWLKTGVKANRCPSYETDKSPIAVLSGKKTYYLVLKKGTYYLFNTNSLNDSDGYGRNLKVRWSFIKTSAPGNYCKARAKVVAAGKKHMICFNHGYELTRWYKVTLKKKKTLTINLKSLVAYLEYSKRYTGDDYFDFDIHNSDWESISCPSLTETSYRTAVLPKGTYYIRIFFNYDNLRYRYGGQRLCTFSWK